MGHMDLYLYRSIKYTFVNAQSASHFTAFDIDVCERMLLSSYTQIYLSDGRQCTVLNTQRQTFFRTCSTYFSVGDHKAYIRYAIGFRF